jgi:hypothetical protein
MNKERMQVGEESRLDVHKPSTNAAIVATFAVDGVFWANLQAVLPLLRLNTTVIRS